MIEFSLVNLFDTFIQTGTSIHVVAVVVIVVVVVE